jgi:hypothetical protein
MPNRRRNRFDTKVHVNKLTRHTPGSVTGSANNGQEGQTVTLTEAVKALRVLRAEFADLRMLIRAATASGDTADTVLSTSPALDQTVNRREPRG